MEERKEGLGLQLVLPSSPPSSLGRQLDHGQFLWFLPTVGKGSEGPACRFSSFFALGKPGVCLSPRGFIRGEMRAPCTTSFPFPPLSLAQKSAFGKTRSVFFFFPPSKKIQVVAGCKASKRGLAGAPPFFSPPLLFF